MQELLSKIFSTTWGRVGAGAVLALIVTLIAVLSTGGSDDSKDDVVIEGPTVEATATPEPTATPTPSPTPVPEIIPVSPLNGMPFGKKGSDTTRVLGVKVDNHVNARPQTGIDQADMIVEIWVEGITRFLTLWQQTDTDKVGPIRSMRPTDFAIQNYLESTFVNSGGQSFVAAIGNASNVRFFQEPAGTFRVSDRYAPHNLYGDTTALRTLDDRGDYDEALPPLWSFDEMPADSAPATEILTSWLNGYTASWTWNGTEYERTTEGAPHEYLDDEGVPHRVTADTLIMLEMSIYTAGSGSGSPVPASTTTGTGTASVFADGKVQQGTWARESDTEWFDLTLADGTEMMVPPGRLWLILPPPEGVTFTP